jgi:ABC-2 type transport system permease protein
MIKYLLEKEFKQFFRNKFLPKVVIVMPLFMILVFPWAANMEVSNIKVTVIDNDRSAVSDRLINKVDASEYFIVASTASSFTGAIEKVEMGEADIILEIPSGFESVLIKEGQGKVMISANAVNGTRGGMGSTYLSGIILSFAGELVSELGAADIRVVPGIKVASQVRYNPEMDYKRFMIPAIMVMLLTIICGFLPAMNIVSEKESGTIEQINVTPVPKILFIVSKLIPYWIVGFVVLSLCFLVAFIVYGFAPLGSLFTIYCCAIIYVFCVSGLGLVISNYSSTMQQAMFVTFFFMLVMLLISGLFTPINSMPQWAQNIADFNPLKYFIQIMRSVYLKGSSILDLIPQLMAISGFALFLNSWAVLSYRKRGW